MSEKRVLLVKTSSLGDVVHLLPALTEAARQRPDVRFDWMVEPAYAQVPAWHPAVASVIEIPFRDWRTRPWSVWQDGRWAGFVEQLRQVHYDLVIDAQGLAKSAFLAMQAVGRRAGPSFASARESIAALTYGRRLTLTPGAHAVERLRELLAQSFGYEWASHTPANPTANTSDYGLQARVASLRAEHGYRENRVLLLPGTTWANKRWPLARWTDAAARLVRAGLDVRIVHGNDEELARAQRIATGSGAEVAERGDLAALFQALATSAAVIGVDSGVLHLAAAAGVPGVALYGPTDPHRTGPWQGVESARIQVERSNLGCSPCLSRTCRSSEPLVFGADGAALEPPCLGGISAQAVVATVLRQVGSVAGDPD